MISLEKVMNFNSNKIKRNHTFVNNINELFSISLLKYKKKPLIAMEKKQMT
jgi:hypothetical protein